MNPRFRRTQIQATKSLYPSKTKLQSSAPPEVFKFDRGWALHTRNDRLVAALNEVGPGCYVS